MPTSSSALAAGERNGLSAAVRATRLIFLVSGIDMAAWAPMVPYAKARLGLNEASLGLLLLAFSGGSMVSSMLAWPSATLIGFVLVGLGAANIVPVMFGAAGRLPGTSPGRAIATVTTRGYAGLLSDPALIGLLAQASSLPVALGAVAGLLLLTAASAGLAKA